MKKKLHIIVLFFLIIACKKQSYSYDKEYNAKIIAYDLNCSMSILSFSNDSIEIKKILGESSNNYYQSVNLGIDKYNIGQEIKIKVRKAANNELPNCITLYPTNNYKNIFVIESRLDFE